MNVHDRKIESMTGAQPTARKPALQEVPPPEAQEGITSPPETQDRQERPKSGPAAGRILAATLRIGLKTLLPFAVVAAGYLGYRALVASKPEAPVRPQQELAYAIKSATVEAGNYQPVMTLFGSTVAGRQVDIRSLVSGQIVETSDGLREGGLVEAGALLLKIDPIDYRTGLTELKAQRAETRAKVSEFEGSLATQRQSLTHALDQLKLAEIDLERAEPLAKRGAVSERTVDDRRQILFQRRQAADEIENNLKVWEARIIQQKAAVTRLDTAIERAERRLAETELRAPFSAYVTEVGAQVGRMVGVNDKVATLIDRDWIEARFNLTDDQFGRIVAKEGKLPGREITVRWVLGSNTFSYPAVIERIGARISSATGGVEVYARIKSPNETVPLRPGAFVEIDVPDMRYDGVFRLPSTALYSGDRVYAIENERLVTRKVRVVGGIDEDLLLEGDLKNGDRVMLTRISTPGDGVKVSEAATP